VNNLGVGNPVTVINAGRENISCLLPELRRGNVWFTNTGFCDLHLSVNGNEMGSNVELQKKSR